MKKVFLLLCLGLAAQLGYGQPTGYLIQGELVGADSRKVYLTQRGRSFASNATAQMLDSAMVRDGKFELKGSVEIPTYYALLVEGMPGWKVLLLENTRLRVQGRADSIWTAKVTGSREMELAEEFDRLTQPLKARLADSFEKTMAAYKAEEKDLALRHAEQNKKDKEALTQATLSFIKAHPEAYLSLFELANLAKASPKTDLKSAYAGLSERLKRHPVAKELSYTLYERETLTILGALAIDFTQPDLKGEPVRLSDLRGKYVLLDFWASWCRPCRLENPILARLYEQHRDKGFEIVSVSLDEDRAHWQKAVQKDGMSWVQVSDLKGWGNAVAVQYGIQAVPANFLLDREGRIVAKNLKGKELGELLVKLMNQDGQP